MNKTILPIFTFLLIMCINGCSPSFSPVGEWELYTIKKGKWEKVQTPPVVMKVHPDGTFLATAFEKEHTERNQGKWTQKGSVIVLTDKTGTHRARLTSEKCLTMEEQPFRHFGLEILYVKKPPAGTSRQVISRSE